MTDLTLTSANRPEPADGVYVEAAPGARPESHRWCIAGALTAIVVLVLAPMPATGRVLTPAATDALQKAFDSVPMCRIGGIWVDSDTATVRLCLRAAPQSCFSVQLDDPETSCDGEDVGPWCLHWSADAPSDAVHDAVRTALRTSEEVWSQPAAARNSGAIQFEERRDAAARALHVRPLALALLLVAVPVLAGIGLGRTLRRWRWWWLVVCAAAAALSVGAAEWLQQVGTWDPISVGTLLIAGLLLGAARIDRRNAVLLVVASTIALAGLECAVRWWLPPPPQFPSPEDASFLLTPAAWDAGCAVLYGPAGVDGEIALLRESAHREPRKRGPLVVHLGDSMTFGEGVRDAEAFPALLNARQPGVVHANYGVWAVGTDFEYLLLQNILTLHPAAMVVLHVYVGNDIFDIDRFYACCDAGPLLDYSPAAPTARCTSARWGFPLALRLSRSPPPYPLRVATGWSYAARYAAAAFSRLVSRLEPTTDFIRTESDGTEPGWDHFAQIVTTMRDDLRARTIELVVTLLPNRQALESTDAAASPSYRTRRRVAALTAQLGIRTLDAWDVFAAAVKRDGARRYFREEHDIHFTPEGHRLLADWLEAQLPPVPRPPMP